MFNLEHFQQKQVQTQLASKMYIKESYIKQLKQIHDPAVFSDLMGIGKLSKRNKDMDPTTLNMKFRMFDIILGLKKRKHPK